MPVIFNEPLSFLQRVAEYMEYAKLLKQAVQEESPILRLQVRGKSWQNVNCILHNVLVGQLWMEQLGALEIKQYGGDNLRAKLFFKSGTWNGKDLHRVEGFITDQNKRRLLFLYGKWTERLRSCDPSFYEEALEKAKLEAKSPAKEQGSPGHKKVLAKLSSLKVGAFKPLHQDAIDESSSMDGEDTPMVDEIPGSITLWEVTPRPSNSSNNFQFTTFAMSLNELEPTMENTLCPTDSRLRPDIRKLEMGDQDGAASEKARLEEKQRDSRKIRKHKKGTEYVPRWFQSGTNPYTGQEDWIYRGEYWNRNYTDVEDIF